MNSIFSLLLSDSVGSINIVELTTRSSWWINHPQANTIQRKHPTPISSLPLNLKRGALPCLGAWVGSQRKRPHCATPLSGVGLRLPNPPLIFLDKGTFLMIYSFLIAPKGTLLSNLNKPTIVRFSCSSAAIAKAALNGMPAALMSRIPTGRAL